jgi:RimJ/RimL family protein N-acetyltransferase
MNNFSSLSDPRKILPLFPQPQLTLVMEAIAAGNSPGTIWVDDDDCPHSAFIWDRAHCYYCGGYGFTEGFNDSIRDELRRIVPEALHSHLDLFKVYYTSDPWKKEVFTLFEKWEPELRERTFFTLGSDEVTRKDFSMPDYSLHKIGNKLLESSLKNSEYVIEEIESCWHSLSQFLTRGFGFCLSHTDEIIAWCTAEYVSGTRCGIGIETLRPYQNKGCATVLASTFVNYCLSKGICPHWDSWTTNFPSMRVAEKVGFRKIMEYSVAFGSFSE